MNAPPELGDVQPLVVRVEALLPLVTQLAQEAYAAQWAFEDGLDSALLPDEEYSDEEYEEIAVTSGIRALHDGMSELTCQAAAAVDFYVPDAGRPAWFVTAKGLRGHA